MNRFSTISASVIIAAGLGVALAYWSVRTEFPVAASIAVVPREESCGPKCLWVACARLGLPADWLKLQQTFRDGTTNGTSLRELQDAASLMGLTAETDHLTWNDLVRRKIVAILYFNKAHFVTVDTREVQRDGRKKDKLIRVYDPNLPAAWVNRRTLTSNWSGESLLLSVPDPTPERPGPMMQTKSLYEDIGLVQGQLEARYRFLIRNVGKDVLTLKLVGASCHCADAKLSSNSIGPGKEGSLDVSVDLENKGGRFVERVVLKTNDVARQTIYFSMCGATPRRLLVSSQRVYTGKVSPGTSVVRSIGVYDPGDGELLVGNVSIRLSKTTGDSSNQPICTVKKLEFAHVGDKDRKLHELSPIDTLLEFKVSVPANCDPGPFEFECVVETNREDAPRITVRITGVVLPDLVASPAAVVLNVPLYDKTASGQCLIESRSGQAIDDLHVNVHSMVALTTELTKVGPSATCVRISVTLPENRSAEDFFEGTIDGALPDGRKIQVPFVVAVHTSK